MQRPVLDLVERLVLDLVERIVLDLVERPVLDLVKRPERPSTCQPRATPWVFMIIDIHRPERAKDLIEQHIPFVIFNFV